MTQDNLIRIAAAINEVINSVCTIIFEQSDSKDYISSFDLRTRTIYIDSRYINGIEMTNNITDLEKSAIAALAHEKRHIYQNDHLTDVWRWEFDNYKKPADGMEEYFLQEIEIDANAFSRLIQQHFFNEYIVFQGQIEIAVEKRAEELRKIYGAI